MSDVTTDTMMHSVTAGIAVDIAEEGFDRVSAILSGIPGGANRAVGSALARAAAAGLLVAAVIGGIGVAEDAGKRIGRPGQIGIKLGAEGMYGNEGNNSRYSNDCRGIKEYGIAVSESGICK